MAAFSMTFSSGLIMALLSIIFGVLVIVFPKLLRYLVGGYFILTGALYLINVLI